MFSHDIVGSDAFIEMPATSQVLYFHLGMRADDDGFVNPQITMRMVGSNKNDLDVLVAKRFVLPFESGVIVIKHWRINNFIRKDRYKPTNYTDERKLLNVKENMAYTLDNSQGKNIALVPWKSEADIRSTNGQPNDSTLVNVGEERRGKDRIGKRESSVEFLRTVPNDVLSDLSVKYKIDPKGIKSKAYDLVLYCEQKGKRYSNYKSFLENAIRKDKNKLQVNFPYVETKENKEQEKPLTPEQVQRNRELKAGIANMLRSKT